MSLNDCTFELICYHALFQKKKKIHNGHNNYKKKEKDLFYMRKKVGQIGLWQNLINLVLPVNTSISEHKRKSLESVKDLGDPFWDITDESRIPAD